MNECNVYIKLTFFLLLYFFVFSETTLTELTLLHVILASNIHQCILLGTCNRACQGTTTYACPHLMSAFLLTHKTSLVQVTIFGVSVYSLMIRNAKRHMLYLTLLMFDLSRTRKKMLQMCSFLLILWFE